jgi:hypothetical protein
MRVFVEPFMTKSSPPLLKLASIASAYTSPVVGLTAIALGENVSFSETVLTSVLDERATMSTEFPTIA